MSDNQKPAKAYRTGALKGTVRAPGDKSISHRSIIFGAMAKGKTRISGLLRGADILSTIGAMRGLGAVITEESDGTWSVKGVGAKGLRTPTEDIDCGNAGTGVRLIMGAAAGYRLRARFTGDASLSTRPMNRILDPLRDMGITAEARTTPEGESGRLPVTLTSDGKLKPLTFEPPHASAQVKSAILLAGVNTHGTTTVIEPTLTRDHTENMLRAFGVPVDSKIREGATHISVTGPAQLTATAINVPGDPSSAAFPIVAALITPGSDVVIENVMMNPTRVGLFETLTEMGAFLRADNFRKSGGETIADIHVKHSKLSGVIVPEARAASMIDEYPVLAVAAAFANGTTVMNGIGELRVKESDRIQSMLDGFIATGVQAEDTEDGMIIQGSSFKGGIVDSHGDHRIAMAFAIAALKSSSEIRLNGCGAIATSFPEFLNIAAGCGLVISS